MKINFRTIKIRYPAWKAEHSDYTYPAETVERSAGITYTEAKRIASKARCKYRGAVLPGRLGQTRLREIKGTLAHYGYAVRLHSTDVVTFLRNGSVELRSGGWYTPTTKDRIETYGGVSIASSNGRWYVSAVGDNAWNSRKGARYWEFKEGMRIRHTGNRIKVTGAGKAFTNAELQAEFRRVKNERARERRAARKAAAEFKATERASACWECSFQALRADAIHHDGHVFCGEACLDQYREATDPDAEELDEPGGDGELTADEIKRRVLARTPEENRAVFRCVRGGSNG